MVLNRNEELPPSNDVQQVTVNFEMYGKRNSSAPDKVVDFRKAMGVRLSERGIVFGMYSKIAAFNRGMF